ncbi:MAG: Uma2 family endonuclease [Armatimonadetes bacterium]|nr:Uma2 family endonuclease [Armatimonadota bacterium]
MLPPLEMGDHLDQPTFHARYLAMPEDVKAELIGGRVYMPSPARAAHGKAQVEVVGWLRDYKAATPGVVALDNTTAILAEDSEPQPDAALTIAPERGGQTREEDGWVVGPPELAVEVASSSEAYDLYEKRDDYERYDVREYVAVVLREPRVVWFIRRGERFEEWAPGEDGILQSETFPGLWLDPAALLRLDTAAVRVALERGLASLEHETFVRRLSGAD